MEKRQPYTATFLRCFLLISLFFACFRPFYPVFDDLSAETVMLQYRSISLFLNL